jgi:magnesium chelatase accessory protein
MSARLQWDTDGATWPHRQASRFVDGGGLRWHAQLFAHASEAAPRLLLLHGTGASTHSWRDLVALLTPHCSVLALDLPGHGFSAMPPGGPSSPVFSLPGMARSLTDLLQVLPFAPDWIVGHSAGAALAVRSCLDGLLAPRGVVALNGALVPLDGWAGQLFSPLAKLLALAPYVPEVFAWRAAKPSVLHRLLDGTGSHLSAEGRALYHQLTANPGHVAGALGMVANWDLHTLWADLPRLHTPLHLLVGSNDLIVPPHSTARILDVPSLQSSAQMHHLRGLGHLAHEEQPGPVAQYILGLVRKQ